METESNQEESFPGASDYIAERYWVISWPIWQPNSVMFIYHRLSAAIRWAHRMRSQGMPVRLWDNEQNRFIEG